MIEEEEINLLPYFRTLMRRWKLIILLALGTAFTGAAISLASPPTFVADSQVAVASLGAKPIPEAKSYLDLATDNRLLTELSKRPSASVEGASSTIQQLRTRLKASPGSDPSLINLRVTDSDPQRSLELVRDWTDLFLEFTLSTFNPGKEGYDLFLKQLKNAQQELRQAEAELSALESRNQLGALLLELTSQRGNMAALFSSKANLQTATENISSIRNRLSRVPPDTQGDGIDDAAMVLIQSSILSPSVQGQLPHSPNPAVTDERIVLAGAPLQPPVLQLQIQGWGNRTVASQLASLDGIEILIRDRNEAEDKQIESLRISITKLESRIGAIRAEQSELFTQRDALKETSTDLAGKVSQAKASLETAAAKPRVIVGARVEATPQPRATGRNAVIGMSMGIMLGIAIALGYEHLESRRQDRLGSNKTIVQS